MESFSQLSEVDGHNIRLTDEGHMPNLNDDTLVQICKCVLHDRDGPPPLKTRAHTYALIRASVYMTVLSQHRNMDHVMLRKRATSSSKWYADGRYLKNGASIRALKQNTDEDGFEMLFVESQGIRGWMYAINVRELN